MQPEQPNSQAPPPNLYPNRPVDATPYPQQYVAASQKRGGGKTILVLFLALMLIGVSGFAAWAFLERSNYKNNVDSLVAQGVEEATADIRAELEQEFADKEMEPFRVYQGPPEFGNVKIAYPKTWSAHVLESNRGGNPIEAWFHPDYVPDQRENFIALTVEVVNRSYDQVLQSYDSPINRGLATSRPVEISNVPGVLGTKIEGEIANQVQGAVALFQIRDKTLILTSQSTEFLRDFDRVILANLSFNP